MSERKPSEPTSDLNIEILQKLSEYLHPHWRSLINGNNTLLRGKKIVNLFNLEKMRQSKILRLKVALKNTLPTDTYEYLLYQRRRVQKRSKRQERDQKAQENASNFEMEMVMLRHTYRLLQEEKDNLQSEIRFYEELTHHSQQF